MSDTDRREIADAAGSARACLVGTATDRVDAYRMIRRSDLFAGVKPVISCHPFRATGITACFEAVGTLKKS